MAVLHMETERVHASGGRIQRFSDGVAEAANQLQRSLYRLHSSWSGSSADRFASDMRYVLRRMQQVADEGNQLSRRVSAEVDEWKQVDNIWKYENPPQNRRFYTLPTSPSKLDP